MEKKSAKQPLVSIVMVNYNGKHHLEYSIPAIKKQDYENYEIIVSDNGSTDGSLRFLRENYPKIKIVENGSNIGFCRANNSALPHVNGEYINFLGNDTRVDKNYLVELVRYAESHAEAIVGSKLLFFEGRVEHGGTWISRFGFAGTLHRGEEDQEFEVIEIPYTGATSLLISKRLFEELEGFNEDIFIYWDDVDLAFRAKLLGYPTMFIPTSVVHHMCAGTMRKNYARIYGLNTRYGLMTLLEVFSLRNLMYCIPGNLLINMVRIIFELITLRFDIAWENIKGISWVIFNIKRIMKRRKVVQSNRRTDDGVIMKFSDTRQLFRGMRLMGKVR